MRAVSAVFAFIACVAFSARALASPENVTYSLGWTRMPGAEPCVGAAALARAVEARLGHPAWAAASAADVLIEGYVEKQADAAGWHVHLVLTDAKGAVLGHRDIVNDDAACPALEQPLTLMLALIIDPQLLLSGGQGERPPPSAGATFVTKPSEPPRDQAEPARSSPPPDRSGHGEIQLGIAAGAGLLPGIATGIVLNQELMLGTWSVELGGRLWLPREREVDSNRSATFSLVEIAGRACPFMRREKNFSLRACGGLEGGVVVADGFGFERSDQAMRPAVFVSGSLAGSLRMGGLVSLGLRLTSLVPILRERFLYLAGAAENEVFRMSVVAGAADLSVGVQF